MDETAICSEYIDAGKRSYNFRVRQKKDGSKYLLITEYKESGEQKIELQNIVIYGEDMDKFMDGLIKMLFMFQ